MNIIILAGGKLDHRYLSLGGYDSYGMYPVRGKPFISWVINNVSNRSNKAIVVIDQENTELFNFLNNHKHHYNIEILINDGSNILETLSCGLEVCDSDIPTKIVLGDTMVINEPKELWDTVLTSKNFYTSKRWCLIEKDSNNRILKFLDKQEFKYVDDKEVVVGIYNVSDTKLLKKLSHTCLENQNSSLTELLESYKKEKNLTAVTIDKWLDFGNSHSIVKASHELFNTRHFNSISVDDKGVLTKASKNKKKLNQEYNWFISLPDDLKVFTPRIISKVETESHIKILSEIYGYQTLSEIFVYGNKNLEDWCYILEVLIKSYNFFSEYTSETNFAYLKSIYVEKTIERIESLKKDTFFRDLLVGNDFITINGIKYKNFNLLKDWIFEEIESICDINIKSSIVHGDLCFSNILLDPINYFVKFIDPRGDFIYGDPRYDMAKLRHSISGLYDFIVLNEYYVKNHKNNSFELKFFINDSKLELAVEFDKILEKNKFKIREIKFIESLLFLTMIPLHSDDKDRQLAFYLNAIMKFNSIKDL